MTTDLSPPDGQHSGTAKGEADPQTVLARRNRRLLFGALGMAVGMVGVSYAAVPLYDLFCRVTGYGGTTQVGAPSSTDVLDRTVRVRFTADTDRRLPWQFAAETREIELRIGEAGLVYYQAENMAPVSLAGTAVYNVTPHSVGLYFHKTECFCFQEQWLEAGQSVNMPVYFYVDPAIADDPNLDDITTITLSYRFFRARSNELDDAVEDYYRGVEQVTEAEPAIDPSTALPADAQSAELAQ